MHEYNLYWDRCWKDEEPAELYQYLDMYYKVKLKEIDLFKEHNIVTVCDAACGFGAYSLAFASNSFHVHSFDISETAVEITMKGLKKYGIDDANVKVASILDTGYAGETFDGVIAHAVLDHLIVEDTKKALDELFRITVPNGLILLSFDMAEKDDFTEEHITLKDGTMEYTNGARKGMLFHPYGQEEISELLKNYHIVCRTDNQREKRIILQK